MGGGIDQPGAVVHNDQAQGDAPKHQAPATSARGGADPEQQGGQGDLQQQEVGVQPAVVGILGQVAGEAGHCAHGGDGCKHPAHVAPPEAFEAAVVVNLGVGKLVVVAVQAHPIDRAVLAAEGAAGGEETLQPLGHPEGAVAEHAVVADRHAQAGGDPIEHQEAGHGGQAPELGQQGHHRQHMDDGHEADGDPGGGFRALGASGLAMARPVQGLGAALAADALVDEGGLAGGKALGGWCAGTNWCGHNGPAPY